MRQSYLLVVLLLVLSTASAQLWVQDFETNGLNTAYTSASVFTTNLNGYFNRTNGSNISNVSAPYSNKNGNFVWAGENLNITGGAGDGLPNKTITFSAINVTGQTGLQFRGLFGSGNPNAGWDYDDILYVEYSMNGGPWVKILQFAASGFTSNSGLYHDADLNGLGEGVALTPALQQFTANIPATGTSLQLRIYASCTAQSEEFAFDYLRLYSTTTSIAGCTLPSASNYNAAATINDGSCSIAGCTDSQSLNYNSGATINDGSCVFTVPNIHFNEIHFNPNEFLGYTDATHEFVELHNNTNAAVSIAGWRISGGIDCIFPIGASIPANGFVLVVPTATTYAATGVTQYVYTDDLNNVSENIRLTTASNVLVDQVTYFSNCWPTGADGNGPSLELRSYSLNNDTPENYCTGAAANGTPGTVNSCFTTQIPGCTLPNATNYNPQATFNDGSCIILGCTYAEATNFNASATTDDGSCLYAQLTQGCTYPAAINFNPAAQQDDGSCIYPSPIPGCTNSNALNYNANATIDNGTCVYAQPIGGCTYNEAINYNAAAQVDDGTCQFAQPVPGCTNATASNYNANATIDDGSCAYVQPNSGCTYQAALNYDASASIDDGSCVFGTGIAGCTYANALNYDSGATIDNGSCLFTEIIEGCTSSSALNYNAAATFDNGSCVFLQPILGCTYTNALNYNPSATADAGNCQFAATILGCTNSAATNYNAAATFDDGSCVYAQATFGCTYSTALNYNSNATADDGSCIFPEVVAGCTNASALNYNPMATLDDGSCLYEAQISGCTYSVASNYLASATSDDGSCLFNNNPSSCPEDLDGDLIVGVSDLLLFIAAFGNTCN
jgi:hypothetical protein